MFKFVDKMFCLENNKVLSIYIFIIDLITNSEGNCFHAYINILINLAKKILQ